MKKRFFLPLLICMTTSIVASQSVRFPKYQGWVNDFARVIEPYYQERMELLASEVKQKTGVELTVVTVKQLDGLSVEDYANRLAEAWGIGEKGKDNGVLILLAMQERDVRIEVGYDLEGILPDGLCGEILDDYVLPDFRNDDYGRGLYRGALGVTQIVAKDAGVQITGGRRVVRETRSSRRDRGGGLFFIIILIVLMIVTRGRILPWLFLAMMMGGGGRGGSFGGGGGFGGGFGGFGGGMTGGGGASRSF